MVDIEIYKELLDDLRYKECIKSATLYNSTTGKFDFLFIVAKSYPDKRFMINEIVVECRMEKGFNISSYPINDKKITLICKSNDIYRLNKYYNWFMMKDKSIEIAKYDEFGKFINIQ